MYTHTHTYYTHTHYLHIHTYTYTLCYARTHATLCTQRFPSETWDSLEKDPPTLFDFPEGEELLKKFQNPSDADELTKIQDDLNKVTDLFILYIHAHTPTIQTPLTCTHLTWHAHTFI